MKIKSDFVTNSSSASFIIADLRGNKKKIFYQINKKIKVDLLEILPYDKIEILKRDDLGKWGRCEKEFLKMREVLNDGGILYSLYAHDSAGILEAGFCTWGIWEPDITTKDIKVIRGDGGY